MATTHKSRSKGQRPGKLRKRNPSKNDPQTEIELDPSHLDAVEFATVRQQVTNLVANRALEVVQQMLEHSKRGNYQAMKYLFEMVGLFPVTTPEETPAGDPLAQKLLSRLGVPERPGTNAEAAKRDPGERVEADAVK